MTTLTKKTSKTVLPSIKGYKRDHILIDANGLVLGRLAAKIASMLMAKHKPEYTPHMDLADVIIVINAEKIALTGNKADINTGKRYYRHTGFPGGIKEVTAGKMLLGKHPERVIKKAVFGMLTRNPLNAQRMRRLFIYTGADHPHAAQQPKVMDFAKLNLKNSI